MNASRNADETTPDETESSPSDDGAPTTGDKIVLGASIAGATLGVCLAGPLGAIVGLRVGGTLAVAGVEKFDESDVENKVKNAVHELRQNATNLRKTAHLTQASFYAIVDHLNLMTARYTASLQRRIVFSAGKSSDAAGGVSGYAEREGAKSIEDKNWKKHALVKCRVLKTGDVWEVLSIRRLTLTQFIILHEQFIAQISMDTCYDKGINVKSSAGADDELNDDDAVGDDDPIAVSTGIIDDMGFEHLEIVDSPKWTRKKKQKGWNRSSTNEASADAARLSASTSSPRTTLSPSSVSPASPASPPNTPAITGPWMLSTDATLTSVENALSDVAEKRDDEDEARKKDADKRGDEDGTCDYGVENKTAVDDKSADGDTLGADTLGADTLGADTLGADTLGAVGGVPEVSSSSLYPVLIDNDDGDNDDNGDGDATCCKKKESDGARNRDICCICMESEAVVILPCYHSFCETCIDSWVASRRSTCPLCRSKMGKRNDRWEVIEELPQDFDVKTEIGKVLLHMAALCGKKFEE